MRLPLLFAAACLALLLAACGDDDGGPSASVTPGASGGSSATAAGGASQPLGVPEEGGPAPLAAGSYHTERLSPAAYFAVGEGWSAQFDSARLLALYRSGVTPEQTLSIIVPEGGVEPDAEGTLTALATPEQFEAWIVANPRLSVSNPSSLQVGNLAARQMEVSLREDVAPGEGMPPGEGLPYLYYDANSFGTLNGYKQHLIIVDYRGTAVVIAVSAPAEQFGELFAVIEPIVGTLAFTD